MARIKNRIIWTLIAAEFIILSEIIQSRYEKACKLARLMRKANNAINHTFPTFAPMPETPFLIPVVNRSDNPLPQYATTGSSGMDIRAFLEKDLVLQPLERTMVPTGLFIELPQGYEVQVRPRSGLAIKQGLTCLNSPGTVDADYRGEIKVILINLSNEVQTIQSGDRIAQMVLQKVENIVWQPGNTINETERGAGGFGHTGKQ